MADNHAAGGLVKKLLFPASSSGANDTFLRNHTSSMGRGVASPGRVSPPSAKVALTHHPTARGSHHNNKAAAVAPPRFFSSTHPSADHSSQQITTPARVPNSPPVLQRKPVTPSREIMAMQAPKEEATTRVDETLSFLKDFQKNTSVEDAKTEVHDNTTRRKNQEVEDAKTEVHDNTARGKQQQQEALLAASLKDKNDPLTINGDKKTEGSDNSDVSAQNQSMSAGKQTGPSPAPEEDDRATPFHKSKNEEDHDQSSIEEGIQSYPSYYDNPYINPYTSAMKPNDLFRKNNNVDTSMVDSDINSNCSEMGTVIGAPALMADRFAEVDVMEKEGKLAMQHDGEEDDSILDEEDVANYKAFRVNDHDEPSSGSNHNDMSAEHSEILLQDPFQTPVVPKQEGDHAPKTTGSSEVLSTASQLGTVVGVNQARERLADIEAMTAQIEAANSSYEDDDDDNNNNDHPHYPTDESSSHLVEQQPLHPDANRTQQPPQQQQTTATISSSCLPIREPHPHEEALSVVDSEIDQLVRKASESSGEGNIKSYNSAEVFRAPSGGSLADRIQHQSSNNHSSKPLSPIEQHNDHDKEDEELGAINGARSRDSCSLSNSERDRRNKKRPSSSLQRALTQAHQQIPQSDSESHGSPQHKVKEDEKEEKEDDLQLLQHEQPHQAFRFEVPREENCVEDKDTAVDSSHLASVGSPGRGLASTIQRIGTKLTRRPSPSKSSNGGVTQSPFFFDIDDDEDGKIIGDNKSADGASMMSESDLSSPTKRSDIDPHPQGIMSIHHNNNRHHHGSLSKIKETSPQSPSKGRGSTENSPLDQPDNAQPTFLLKSPGASARLMADFRRESSSGSSGTETGTGVQIENDDQQHSAWSGQVPSILKASSTSLDNHDGPTPVAAGGRKRDQEAGGPFRFARGCLSFDTTADHHYEYDYKRHAADNQWLKPAQSYDNRHHLHATTPNRASSAFRRRFRGAAGNTDNGSTQTLYGSSRSWDISSSMWSATAGAGISDAQKEQQEEKHDAAAITLDASAFRVAPYVRQQHQQHHPHPHGYNNAKGSRLISGARQERIQIMSDNTPQLTNRQRMENLELLQTPQRIEIEREDALNLLACLCERGVALNPADEGETKGGSSEKKTISESDQHPEENKPNSSESHWQAEKNDWTDASRKHGELEPEIVNGAVEMLRELSREQHRSDSDGKDTGFTADHMTRMEVLDELVRSHTYALEMKRAALSASAWLRSIGHTENTHNDNTPMGQSTTEQAAGESENESPTQSNRGTSSAADNAVELLTVKALLHQAQIEAQEKDQAAQRLNEELSKCRAEIGRLRSSRSKASFTSPNRSILDDDSASEGCANVNNDEARKESEGMIADESVVDLDSSLFANEDTSQVVRETDQPLARELKMFKSALHDANAIIQKLHGELQEAKPNDEVHAREAPLIEVSEKAFSVALVDETTSKNSNSFSDQHAENRTVNVRMLDGENFVTDWDQVESLPPPPDHGLRSPIVNALLQQWSADEALHSSLLSWMDNVVASGADPRAVPPLTLSSLDHQVRDGFMMHVLPLLLRRSDVLVDVKTRAHRKTTYDVAVSIKSNARHAGSVRSGRHMENASGVDSVTHSAITAPVRNRDPSTKDLYEVGSTAASYTTLNSGYSTLLPQRGGSDEKCESPQPQAGLMSALGGALGGFLSRRKPNTSFYNDAGIAGVSSYDMGSAVGAAGPGPMDHFPTQDAPLDTRDQEPYHRLVSAPPGRIGVSFVEYRGHAMVSDVALDSPLLGWIFPSDILIAIDEVPVSGMRLKDIVKVLQGRSERQRAMRVISSHAMNEFTMNAKTPS